MPEVATDWDPGHQHGWLVFNGNEGIARLEYLTIDQPFIIFRLVPLTDDTEILQNLMSPSRCVIYSEIRYQNIATDTVATDEEFILRRRAENKVVIRDFRTPPMVPTFGETFWRFVKRFFGRQ